MSVLFLKKKEVTFKIYIIIFIFFIYTVLYIYNVVASLRETPAEVHTACKLILLCLITAPLLIIS